MEKVAVALAALVALVVVALVLELVGAAGMVVLEVVVERRE